MLLLGDLLSEVESVDGWLVPKECDLLLATAIYAVFEKLPGEWVEIGSYCGKSTIILGSVIKAFYSTHTIHAIDPHEGDLSFPDLETRECCEQYLELGSSWLRFLRNIENYDLKNHVSIHKTKSYELSWNLPIGLIFIDALHDYENVSRDYCYYSSFLSENAFVIFHDYQEKWPGVIRFVDELVKKGDLSWVQLEESLAVLRRISAR